jgi:hypothetical protein
VAAILPAEQHAVILVVRAELAPLPGELLDMCLQHGQRERVKAAPQLDASGRRKIRAVYPARNPMRQAR